MSHFLELNLTRGPKRVTIELSYGLVIPAVLPQRNRLIDCRHDAEVSVMGGSLHGEKEEKWHSPSHD